MKIVHIKSNRSLATAIFAVAAAVSLFTSSAASAADASLNLITSPLPINLSTEPGHTVSTDLRVKQNGTVTEHLKVSLMKFGAYGDTGKPQLLDRGPGDDYFDWVKFDKSSFDAAPNVWQTLHMTINVPKTAAFGYYYAVVFSRAGDDKNPGTARTNAINGGSAVLVLLDAVVPNAKRQLSLVSFATDHRFYEFLPSSFSVKFNNTGNVHLVPHGNIFILQGNKQIAALDLNDEQGNILPNSKRILTNDWVDGFPHYEPTVVDGKVKVDKNGLKVNHLVWSNAGAGAKDTVPHLRFGRYTAHLFAVYDDGQRDVPMEATVSFWVIPWRFILAVLFLLAVVGFGLFAVGRATWRWIKRARGGSR